MGQWRIGPASGWSWLRLAPLFVASVLSLAARAQPPEGAGCLHRTSAVEQLLCLADAARAANDPDICLQAPHEGVRWQCVAIYAKHARDPALCDRIPEQGTAYRDLRDLCVSDVAAVRAAPRLCARIVSPGLRDSCYLKLFQALGDASLCQEIVDPGLKSTCTGRPVIVR